VRSTYHPDGQHETRRNSNNTLVSTLYDDYGEPSSRRRDPSTGPNYQIDYGYDARGKPTAPTTPGRRSERSTTSADC
jgi:YD repeat-containing protein